MLPLPNHYDAKTIKILHGRRPRELLLLALEGRLKVGIYVTECHVALIKHGCIKDSKTGEEYGGIIESKDEHITDILYLDRFSVRKMLKKGSIRTGFFAYFKNGFDSAQLLISKNKSVSIEIRPEDLCIPTEAMGIVNPQYASQDMHPRKRGYNELNEVLCNIYRDIYFENIRSKKYPYPTTNEFWHYIKTQQKEMVIINKIEGEMIYWTDYKNRPQKMSRDTLKNKLTAFKKMV